MSALSHVQHYYNSTSCNIDLHHNRTGLVSLPTAQIFYDKESYDQFVVNLVRAKRTYAT